MNRSEYFYLVKELFNNDSGQPFELTPSQEQIIANILDPDVPRLAVKTYTQFGKSDVTAISLVLLSIIRREKILIVAPNEKQASIIMGRVIQHLFDNPILMKAVQWEGSIERLRQERSKKRMTMTTGSEIMIITADADRSVSKEGKTLMGFGATVVVIDEASLLNNTLWAKILRMVGGRKTGKIIKLGNPWNRWDKIGAQVTGNLNHFFTSFEGTRYEKITVDYRVGIKEGRITEDFVQEARDEIDDSEFRVMYDCEFPEDDVDNPFFRRELLDKAVAHRFDFDAPICLGIDVARGGGDLSVVTIGAVKEGRIRVLKQIARNFKDTMMLVGLTRELLRDYNEVTKVAVDAHGVGGALLDAMRSDLQNTEGGKNVTFMEYLAGSGARRNKQRYANLKTEVADTLLQKMRQGMADISGGADELMPQLSMYARSTTTAERLKIADPESKSPDFGDSLLAFVFASMGSNSLLISDFSAP